MKKIILFLLALLMIACFCSCNSNTTPNDTETNPPDSVITEETKAPENASKETETKETTYKETEPESSASNEPETEAEIEPEVTETIESTLPPETEASTEPTKPADTTDKPIETTRPVETAKPAETTAPACTHPSFTDVTCTSPSVCVRCGYKLKDAYGHNWVKEECTKDYCAYCYETRNNGGQHEFNDMGSLCCTKCGNYVSCEDLGSHNWEKYDCATDRCARCLNTKESGGQHDFSDVNSQYCTVCGAYASCDEIGGHNWEKYDCITDRCTRCSNIKENGGQHDFSDVNSQYCIVCYSYASCEELGGHNWERSDCTEDYCTRCYEVRESGGEHDLSNIYSGYCSGCGTYYSCEELGGHNWVKRCINDWCTRCNETKEVGGKHDSIDINTGFCFVCRIYISCEEIGSHNWDGEADCVNSKRCTRCNIIGEFPLGHDFGKDQYGYSTIPCSRCEQTFCEIYSHKYRWNYCQGCGGFDEETSTLAQNIINSIITPNMTEFEKVKAIHDYIVNNTEYDYENYINDTIPAISYSPLGALKYGKAVCNGYAKAFELLCRTADISCVFVSGLAKNSSSDSYGGHAWNQVMVDGKWYNIDVTWDDPVNPNRDILRYTYFLVSDDVLYLNHKTDYAPYVCAETYPYNPNEW